ncbi:uncharacterized protein O3C94_008512 [Discoglossus pictus]
MPAYLILNTIQYRAASSVAAASISSETGGQPVLHGGKQRHIGLPLFYAELAHADLRTIAGHREMQGRAGGAAVALRPYNCDNDRNCNQTAPFTAMSSEYKDWNSRPIQAQPEGQLYNQNQLSRTSAIVPPGLEALVEVEEVILKKRVFQTRRGQVLFSICKDSECCGPPINIWLRDSRKREVIKVYLAPYDGCCSNYSYLQIDAPYRHPIGFVKLCNTTGIQKFSIQNAYEEPVFTAVCEDPIQIISVNGNDLVAQIKKEKESGSTEVIFQFPMDMDAKMKAVIMGALLYVNYRLQEMYRQQRSSTSNDSGWMANAVDFGDSGLGYGGGDFGGGGDWGGGGGDCGGGDCGGDGGGGD